VKDKVYEIKQSRLNVLIEIASQADEIILNDCIII